MPSSTNPSLVASGVVTEGFAGTPGPLTGTWKQQRGTGTVNRNGAGVGVGSMNAKDLFAFWTANTFTGDQYSQVRIAGGLSNGAQYAEVLARASGSGEGVYAAYLCYTDGIAGAGHTEVAKNVNGSQITLRSFASSFATNDVLKISAVGSTITCYRNGVAIGSVTDASLASGAPGIGVYGNVVSIDDWEGGSLTTVADGPPPVASVTVTPDTVTETVGTSEKLTATLKDANGSVLTGRAISWASSSATNAAVDTGGTVTGVHAGTAMITATSEGKAGNAAVTVTAVPVASVTVTPSSAAMSVGATQQFTAATLDSTGATLSGRSVSWSSSDATVASVNATGLVTAAGAGSATITATSEGKTATASVTATIPPVASVSVTPSSATIAVGGIQSFSATTRDANNNVLSGRQVTWSSDAPSVATVNASTGVVTGVGIGSATISATSENQTGSATISVTPQPAGPPGPLHVSTDNPRYFADPTGRIVYLTGSHFWKNVQDDNTTNPPAPFDNVTYLNMLQSHNHNFQRLWVWEQARWSDEVSYDHWFAPTLYVRSGPGTAADGGLKFDLNQINPEYLARLRQRVIDAGAKGIYVSVMLFDGWSVTTKPGWAKQNPWLAHPFNKANNINGIDGDTNGDESGLESQTLSIPAVTALQEAYVRAVIDAVNDLDNVLYEITNESDPSSDAWQYHMVDFVRNYEATKAKRHPIGMTVDWPNGSNSTLTASAADWVSYTGSTTSPAVATGSKVSLWDTDHLCGICGDVPWVWKSFTRGHNPLLMDGYDGSPGVSDPSYNPSSPVWEAIRKNLGYARSYAVRMDLAHALPHGELASSGYCLAKPGSEYLAYGGGTNVTLNLSAVPSTTSLTVEWFNSTTGAATFAGTVKGGASRTLRPPSGADVVYVH